MHYLIDTNVLSELSKKHPNSQVAAFLNTLSKNGMFISVITPGEIIKGIEKAKDEVIKKRFSAWYAKVCLWFEGKILDWKAGVHTPRLASVKFIPLNKL